MKSVIYKGHRISIAKVNLGKFGKAYDWKITTRVFGMTLLKKEGRAMVENRKQVEAIGKEVIDHLGE